MSADRPYGNAGSGRSPVMACHGMVATSQPLAAQAGLRILQDGGNAFDAAIAAAAMLAVVEPMMTGPGGDVFLLAHDAPFRETDRPQRQRLLSPAAATPALLAEKGLSAILTTGPCSVSIPGAVDA
ncbi:MAG: gamma-glutamyltransferase [Bryobacterales bacterium]